jgi:WD40 repeat protein
MISSFKTSSVDEEIAYAVEATNFRLCEVDVGSSSDSGTLFSAHWQANDRDEVLLSHGDGMLRVFHTLVNESHYYRLLFQPLTLHVADGASRQVHSHWDKMATIPGRSGAVLFLLGVSRHVHYVTIPNPAAYSRDSFILGNEVLQLWSHSTRVTALSVSPDGALAASGDESGGLRLVVLSKISGLVDSSVSTTRVAADPSLGMLYFNAHSGSIFAVHWIAGGVRRDDRSPTVVYSVCTGSSDFVIRLWTITVDGQCRVEKTCYQQLSTLASHVLSIDSCIAGISLYFVVLCSTSDMLK